MSNQQDDCEQEIRDREIREALLKLHPPLVECAQILPTSEQRIRPQVISLAVLIERRYDLPRTLLTRRERRDGEIEGCISRY
jgi:hypothetical protein